MKKDAIQRAIELVSMNVLPKLANMFVEIRCHQFGYSYHELEKALAHYAQMVEGLECSDPDMVVSDDDRNFYAGVF